MKLATLARGGRDGCLVAVSTDGTRWLAADEIAPNLQAALDDWPGCEPRLRAFAARLDSGEGLPLAREVLAAPLPRAWQWLDGSAFPTHGELMQLAFGLPPIETDLPLMYQGLSHQFLGPVDDVPFPSEEDGIDFEGEFGVITDEVPMGITSQDALGHIKLIIQINDWSLRAIAPIEMKTGFGWIQAKPACSVAPFAATPDELGPAWDDGRVRLDLAIDLNGKRFGNANGAAMAFGFHELVAHAARTRSLPAGTIIGSGTVSNPDFRVVGSSCISERRSIEMIDQGAARTGFMRFGDRVRMEARLPNGSTVFGVIDQQVVAAGN
jgi:fumarylacetoacetate (FAA) hydrolase